jgi:cell shape-determining protein MreC
VLVVLLATGGVLLSYGFQSGPGFRSFRPLKSAVRDSVAPIQRGTEVVLAPVEHWIAGVINYGSVGTSRRILSDLIKRAQEMSSGSPASDQYARVSRLQNLPFVGNFPTVLARVVTVPLTGYQLEAEIDKGSAQGVGVGMAVVDAAGLVGVVQSVTQDTADVELVWDPSFTAGVVVDNGGGVGIVKGDGPGKPLVLSLASPSEPLPKRGDLVYTAGIAGSPLPSGIPVGVVGQTHNANAARIPVRAAASIYRLDLVAVVQWLPGG